MSDFDDDDTGFAGGSDAESEEADGWGSDADLEEEDDDGAAVSAMRRAQEQAQEERTKTTAAGEADKTDLLMLIEADESGKKLSLDEIKALQQRTQRAAAERQHFEVVFEALKLVHPASVRGESVAVGALEASVRQLFDQERRVRALEPDAMELERSSAPVAPTGSAADECAVCLTGFSTTAGDDGERFVQLECGCAQTCRSCFRQNIAVRVREHHAVPWFLCPSDQCFRQVHAEDMLRCGLGPEELQLWLLDFAQTMLKRCGDFVPCENESCTSGFLLAPVEAVHSAQKDLSEDFESMLRGGTYHSGTAPDEAGLGGAEAASGNAGGASAQPNPPASAKPREETCASCSTRQVVARPDPLQDDSFQKMIADGSVRLCPKCNHPTMKDKGICNVIQCGQCAIWWNWKNREFGSNSRELKAKAKSNGTLWNPGELQYQMELQQKDPEAFKRLLEQNGIKYDANYQRGAW